MKYLNISRHNMCIFICLIIISAYCIFVKNYIALILEVISIYLLIKLSIYERVSDLANTERSRLRQIIHLIRMNRHKNDN